MSSLLGRPRAAIVTVLALVAALLVPLSIGPASPAAAAPASAAAAAPVGPSLAAPTVALGSTVTVGFATTGTAYAKDWIALYSSGKIQSTCPSPATHWSYTSSGTQTAGAKAVASGSVTFDTSGWALGTYSVYLCQNDGYTSIGTPLTLSVVNLATASTTVHQGSTLTFGFGAGSSQLSATNCIGLYSAASGATPGHGDSTYWDYVNSGTQTPGATAVASGSLSFDTTGWPTGTYTAYFLYDDAYTDIGSPITITVVPPAADVLDVDFASGAPIDHAQGLAAKTYGAPKVANDATIGAKAATFNGTSDAYQFDFTSQYPKLASRFSIECQFRWNGATIATSGFPSECSGLQSGGMGLIVQNGKLDFELNVGGYKDIYAPIQPGVWYDAMGTWDGATASLYLDGALAASGAAAGKLTLPTPSAKGWSLGADLNGSGAVEQFAPVSIGVARVFTAALSADAVAAQHRITVPFNAVTVTRSGQGTVTSSAASALPGTKVALGATPATGYGFTGWKVTSPADGSVTIAADGTFTMPNAPVAVQAVFTPFTATVRFDGNGADAGTGADQKVTYDTAALLPANPFTRAGFHLAGWATTPDGAPQYSDRARAVNLTAVDKATVTLYAVWHGDVPAGADVPPADLLDVDFADGTPRDNALNAAVTTVGAPKIAPDAQLGKDVASFDGAKDAFQYDFTGSYQKLKAAGALTEECQFRWDGDTFPTGTGTWPSICNGEQSGGGGLMYYDGSLQAELHVGGAYADAVDPAPLERGRWYDAAQVWDGSTLSLYVDGALVASVAAKGSLDLPSVTGGSTPVSLGADLNGTGGTEMYAPISVGSARIWSTALTAAQIATAAKGTAPHDVVVTRSGQGAAAATPGSAWVQDEVALQQTAATGYTFGGWSVTQPSGIRLGSDSALTMPDADVAVTADFAPNGYAVAFDGNGADAGATGGQSLTYDAPATLSANGFTRAGYYFGGWSTSPDELPTYGDGASVVNLTATKGASVILYAFWVPNGQFILRASSTGHGTVTSSTLTAGPGDKVSIAQQADTGYRFTGWQVVAPADGSVTVAADGRFTMPGEPVNVQGAFTADVYTVHFDGNGADGGKMPDQALTYDQPSALDSGVFSRDGYVLSGWATTPDGALAYADGGMVSNLASTDGATVTLYAVWTKLTTAPGSWPTLPGGFVTDTLHLPAVAPAASVRQTVLGLWNGTAPTTFTKADGDDWLSVSASGVVSGTAPADATEFPAEITVTATSGATTSQLLVEVPVQTAPQIETASWNAWADGANVTDAVGKNLQAVASRGIGVLAFQDGGAAMAQQIGAALGWHVATSGDLGVVSAYPFTSAARVGATAAAPALAVTVTAGGQSIRVWDAALDESASDTAARAAAAQAIADEVQPDVFAAGTTPVVLLGDLGAAELAGAFTATGLGDAYRRANPGDGGATWPVFPASAASATRVDYALEAGSGLHLVDADLLSTGFPSATNPAGNSWASDHAAVVATFTAGDDGSAPPTAPTVSVGKTTVAFQLGHGPTAAELLAAVGATASSGASLVANVGGIDATAAGWYTATVYAAEDGVLSDPVTVQVRIAPLPHVTLGHDTATFLQGDAIDQHAVLGQLVPAFTGDGVGDVTVDLSGVTGPGTFPVVVTATDEWGFTAAANATVVVTATYRVTVTAGVGGTASANVARAAAGATVALTATPASGYRLDHWQADGVTVAADGTFTMPAAPVAVRAVFAPIAYTIAYRLAGGTATGANPTTYTVESAPITLSNPTRAGYVFTGWTGPGHAAPSTNVEIPSGTTGDLTFTATWATAVYQLRYDLAGGSVTTPNPTTYTTESGAITLHTPTRYAYTFAGWTGTGLTKPTVTVTIPKGATGDRTYTATWTPAAAAWSAGTIYLLPGTTVFYNGRLYVNAWFSWGETPGKSAFGAWEEIGAPTASVLGTFPAWTPSWIYTGGETVVSQGKVYVAAWYTRGETPGATNGAWEQRGEPVVTSKGTFPAWTASWIYTGGETVASQGHLWKAKYYTRGTAPSAKAGAWQDLGVD